MRLTALSRGTRDEIGTVFDRLEPVLQNYENEGFTWKNTGSIENACIQF
ncbi:hypothetical protein SPIRO4BDMA_50668 [uncultured spirochete]|uniref:Uncharacterized protein n=1 Tax=uncultured spirochete TaxID=156406 RepID=A0A3P3XT89_9SPIR|nr:hypothetical protein SPIRO4BDMA_50668 [uncultured spirochete]